MTTLTLLLTILAVALIVSIIVNYWQKRKLNKTLNLHALQNQNLMLAIRAGNLAVWGYDVKRGHLYNIEGEVFPGNKGSTIAEAMTGVHPDDCDKFVRILQGVVNGEVPSETICIRFKNMYTGEWEYVEKKFAVIKSRTGEVETVIGTHKDVTQTVLAKSQIDELLKKYQYLYKENHTILNSLPTGVSIYDKEGKIFYINQMLCDLLGIKDRDQLLEEASNLWDDSSLFDNEARNQIRKGESTIFNYQIDCSQLPIALFNPSDKILHISCNSSFVKNERSEVESYIFIHRDITNEYNHQLELEESKLKTELAIQASDMVQWEYDVNKRIFHTWNEKTESDILTPADYYQVTHPDNLQEVYDIIALMDSQRDETFEFDTRFKFPSDSQWQYIKITGTPLKQGKDGEIIKYTGFQRNNTQWQNLTEELKATNEMNKLILNNMRSGLVYLSANREVVWENASEKFSLDFTNGVPLFEVGKPCHQSYLGINGFCQSCPLDDVWAKRDSLTIERTLENGNILEIEGNPIIDDKNNLSGIILRIDDISERKRLYEELEVSRNDALSANQLLREILCRIPATIFIKDMNDNFRYIMVNDTFCDIWGISENEIIGKTDFEIMDHELAETYRKADEQVTTGGKPVTIIEETQTNGVYQCWKTIKSSFTSINNRQLLIAMAVDITEIRQTNHELQKAKNKAEESDKLKSAFLANMSHEIRTPLNSIVGFSGLLKDSNDEDEKNEFWNIINANNELLLRLINDILDLSKIEAGAIDLKSAKFNLAERFDDIYSTLKLRNTNNEVEFRCDNPYHKCMVALDENRITQIITNFVTNAFKFTPKGQIKMGYEFTDGRLRLYCTDTGIGIAPEKMHKIFTRFSKLDDFAQGTGLGTAICKAIVDAYGGEIGADSVVNEGSTFWAWVPCEAEIDGLA